MSDCCGEYIIYDQRSGDEICAGCGLAKQLLDSSVQQYDDRILIKTEIEEEIQNICDKHNIPPFVAVETIKTLRLSTKKTRIKAAQVMHKVLIDNNRTRSLKEISSMFHIPFVKIGRYDNVSLVQPSDMSSRVFVELGIDNYHFQKSICTKADMLFEHELGCVSPQTALAVSIALLCADFLSTSTIAGACHISKQTLSRHYKAIIYKKETMN